MDHEHTDAAGGHELVFDEEDSIRTQRRKCHRVIASRRIILLKRGPNPHESHHDCYDGLAVNRVAVRIECAYRRPLTQIQTIAISVHSRPEFNTSLGVNRFTIFGM